MNLLPSHYILGSKEVWSVVGFPAASVQASSFISPLDPLLLLCVFALHFIKLKSSEQTLLQEYKKKGDQKYALCIFLLLNLS